MPYYQYLHLTTKDKGQIYLKHLDMGVDWIAQSFVQTVEDVKESAKQLVMVPKLLIMAKIEKPSACKKY